MTTTQFNAQRLWLTLSNLSGARITYDRGTAPGQGKLKDLDKEVGELDRSRATLDCSGYVKYVVYQGSTHRVRIPAGSFIQQTWLEEMGYRKVSGNDFVDMEDVYDVEGAKKDDVVRIAFRKTHPKQKAENTGSESKGVGNVWLLINGRTYECTTKRLANGPWSFDYKVRSKDVDIMFVLGSAHGFTARGPLLTKS